MPLFFFFLPPPPLTLSLFNYSSSESLCLAVLLSVFPSYISSFQFLGYTLSSIGRAIVCGSRSILFWKKSCIFISGHAVFAAQAFLWFQPLSLQCTGFPCCGVQALGLVGFSSCRSQTLECKHKSCDTWALLLRCRWDLP